MKKNQSNEHLLFHLLLIGLCCRANTAKKLGIGVYKDVARHRERISTCDLMKAYACIRSLERGDKIPPRNALQQELYSGLRDISG